MTVHDNSQYILTAIMMLITQTYTD